MPKHPSQKSAKSHVATKSATKSTAAATKPKLDHKIEDKSLTTYKKEFKRYIFRIYKPNTPDAMLVDGTVVITTGVHEKSGGKLVSSQSTLFKLRNSTLKRVAKAMEIKFQPLEDAAEFTLDSNLEYMHGYKFIGQPQEPGAGYINCKNIKEIGLESTLKSLKANFPKNKKLRHVKLRKTRKVST